MPLHNYTHMFCILWFVYYFPRYVYSHNNKPLSVYVVQGTSNNNNNEVQGNGLKH